MVVSFYIPERGDIVWANFPKKEGHEQRGRRPALVISPRFYNERSELALMCPVTSQEKAYAFEVPLHEGSVKGVVLVDQIQSIDWRARRVKFITKITNTILEEVRHKLFLLIAS